MSSSQVDQLHYRVSSSSSIASSPGRARNGEWAPGISAGSTPSRGLVTVRLNSIVMAASSKAAMAAQGVAGSRLNGYRPVPQAARILPAKRSKARFASCRSQSA